MAQARFQRNPLARSLRHVFIEEAPQITAALALLGAIHRGMRTLHQQCRRLRVLRIATDSGAHTHHHRKAIGRLPGLCRSMDQALRNIGGIFARRQLAGQHHNFIARHACNQIARAQCGLHLPGNVAQHLIADGVAVAVVHVLKTVQVQQDDRHLFTAHLRRFHGARQLLAEPGAIGQARQRVTVCQKLQLLLTLLLLGDVGEHAHVMGGSAVLVLDGAQRHALGKNLAVLALVPDLSAPVPGQVQAGPHLVIKRFVVPPRLEGRGALAQQLRRFVAQKP